MALELLRVNTEVTATRVTEALATQKTALQRRALAVTTAELTAAELALAAAERGVVVAMDANIAANVAQRAALAPVVASTRLATVAADLMSGTFKGTLAMWSGWEIGGFLRKLESVRLAGTYIAETFVMASTGVEALINGDSFTERWEQVKKIHGDFSVIRQQETDESIAAIEQAQRQSEAKTQLLEAEKIAHEAFFKELQSQLKETSSQVETEYARQNAAIKQALEARKAEILASNVSEIEKEGAVSSAIAQANEARLLVIKQAADYKLELIDAVYTAELAKVTAGTIEQKAVEKESIEARLAVYGELEKKYSGIIDELIADEKRHAEASKQLLEQKENLERSTQAAIRTIRQAGMSDENKIRDQKKELDENLSAQRQSLAKGDVNNAKRYGEEAQKLAQQLATQAATHKAGQGYSSTAERFITKFKEARDGIGKAIDMERSAHDNQQKQLAASLEATQGKLKDTQRILSEKGEQLQSKYLLEIDADTRAVDAAIKRIQQPTQSTHTINMVEKRSGNIQRDGNSYSMAPVERAEGGFPRVQGQLPGYGGGDQVKALLEAGEFVGRKEAVQALGGEPAMNEINAGRLPIKRASGGPVDYDMDKEVKKLRSEGDEKAINWFIGHKELSGLNGIGLWSLVIARERAQTL